MIKVEHFTFNPLAENTYILSNEKGDTLIIDPGCYFTEEERALQTYITANGLKPLQLLNTHCHLDHVFGNNWVTGAASKWCGAAFVAKLSADLTLGSLK